MRYIKTKIKRMLYKWFLVNEDVQDAIKINNPDRIESSLGDHCKDIFRKQYNKQTKDS